MKELQNKILELRKELRLDYERIGKNYHLVMKEMDEFLERLHKSFDGINKVETEQIESKY
jgi:hypothetical protein